MQLFIGLLVPFLGTALGAASVYLMRQELSAFSHKALLGFAAGVMVAASVWSLLLPAIQESESMGRLAFLPAMLGLLVGMFFLLLLDHIIPHLHQGSAEPEGLSSGLKKSTMLVLAVTLHNIPEGMAVGVAYAAYLSGASGISAMGALALSIGIALQNFPEGAIVSMPLRGTGVGKNRAFAAGLLSGFVEPLGALLTIAAMSFVLPALPYLLGFAAGAMLYVVVEELIPSMSQGRHSDVGTIFFAFGFALMMALDIGMG